MKIPNYIKYLIFKILKTLNVSKYYCLMCRAPFSIKERYFNNIKYECKQCHSSLILENSKVYYKFVLEDYTLHYSSQGNNISLLPKGKDFYSYDWCNGLGISIIDNSIKIPYFNFQHMTKENILKKVKTYLLFS